MSNEQHFALYDYSGDGTLNSLDARYALRALVSTIS